MSELDLFEHVCVIARQEPDFVLAFYKIELPTGCEAYRTGAEWVSYRETYANLPIWTIDEARYLLATGNTEPMVVSVLTASTVHLKLLVCDLLSRAYGVI